MPIEYEVKDSVLRINCLNWAVAPSIEDSDVAMGIVIDKLLENRGVTKVILAEARENEYDEKQTEMLREIAEAYDKILNVERIVSVKNIAIPGYESKFAPRFAELQFLVMEVLKKDPIRAYMRINREINKIQKLIPLASPEEKSCHLHYLTNALLPIKRILENTKLIQKVKPRLAEFRPGDRSLYRELFAPTIRPNFMLTRFMLVPPKEARLVTKYFLPDKTLVEIYKIPGRARYFYHITPLEFTLSEEKFILLDEARRYLAAHKPSETMLAEPEKVRESFFNIGIGLIRDLAGMHKIKLDDFEVRELATILARYTAGFGILELLLSDEKIQDVYINSPIGSFPVYIYHQDYEECETNLIPTREDAEAWATRFRLYSGRPLDEANPVLDTELNVPGGRARVCAITRTISPYGLGFAFRRHREKPWTIPLFMKVKMVDPLYAGVMSFVVDGGRSLLIAGGRSSGKTSLLNALMLEIMRKFRIVVCEDSVTGDCEILVERSGKMVRTTVSQLIDEMMSKYGCEKIDDKEVLRFNPENIKVFSMSKEGKVILSRVKSFVRHRVAKPIYEIETRTGRRIKVTGDHSLFSLDENGSLKAVKVSELKIKDRIVTPRFLPLNNKPIRKLNLFHHLGKIRNCYVVGDEIKNFVVKNKEVIKKVAISEGYPIGKSRHYPNVVEYWKRQGVLPGSIFSRLLALKLKVPTRGVFIKGRGGSKSLPANISLDKSFLEFIGLWLADGCYDKDAIIISVVDDYTRKVVNDIAKRFGINVRLHSDGFSLVLSSRILKDVMTNVLELKGDSYTKRIPAWCFNLSQKQISYLLRGIFSGDGYLAKEEVGITLSSYNLIRDIQTLLLTFGIIGRVNRFRERDKTYSCRISGFEMLNKFYEKIGFIQNNFMEKLFLICSRHIYRRVTDTIPFSQHFKSEIAKRVPLFESHKYVVENCNMGKLGYEELLLEFGDFEPSLTQKIWTLINSDIFWDEIREIKVYEGENYVYDFSVEHTENFICENILAHNTLELSIPLMQKLGYNIERLKSRSVITRVETELPPDEVLRTALRLGESALIIGEVRSKEATALFEAMRIGALANVVAGTIHGESAYGVFDRVVYDLGVPPTSFKAIDLITICNMLRTPDGLHRFRRVTDLIEVRKHWKEDPLAEDGFVPLMEYSAKEDRLKPTETLLYGESEVLNAIAQRVREWRGAWDRVWDNILLRKRIRETLVEFAEKLKREDMLEAEFVAESNEAFHLICEQVMEEVGGLDSNLIYERWLNWLKNRVK